MHEERYFKTVNLIILYVFKCNYQLTHEVFILLINVNRDSQSFFNTTNNFSFCETELLSKIYFTIKRTRERTEFDPLEAVTSAQRICYM